MAIRIARVSDAQGLARVEAESWRDAYPTLLPGSYLVDGLDPGKRLGLWRRRLGRGEGSETVVAAVEGGAVDGEERIVGYATFGRSRVGALPFGGQLYELYLLPESQGRGLGRRLWTAVAEKFLRAGTASMCVEVLEGNPSRYFYEALGGRVVARAAHPFAGQVLPAFVYAWDDLKPYVRQRRARSAP